MNQPGEAPTLDGTFPRKGLGNPDHLDSFPNRTIEDIFARRSIRRFKPGPIDPGQLDLIVDAGLRAPNGGACQSVVMLVCQDAEVNRELGRISMEYGIVQMAEQAGGHYPVSKAQPSAADDQTMKDAFYGAPVSVSIFTPEIWEVGPLDAALAAENMILAAWSMGVGACCIDRSKLVFATDYGMDLRKRAGIPDDYAPQLQVVFGYPESTARDHRVLYPNRVSWI